MSAGGRPRGANYYSRYGGYHQNVRRQWAMTTDTGLEMCRICGEKIEVGARWHLAHDDSDPTGQRYLGPAHSRCNYADAQEKGDRKRFGPSVTARGNGPHEQDCDGRGTTPDGKKYAIHYFCLTGTCEKR